MPPESATVQSSIVTGPVMEAWQRLLRANCVVMAELDRELREAHGITISDYDVLIQLRDAENGCLRMSDLSRRTLLSRSGMTRLVQGLEADGFVSRRRCDNDQRSFYAALTDLGAERLESARCTHHRGIRRVFADYFEEDAAEQLSELLGRIPRVAGGQGACPSEQP